nr:MAG TPA: hypothetical protein [Bacteriophage sp.]
MTTYRTLYKVNIFNHNKYIITANYQLLQHLGLYFTIAFISPYVI